MTDLAPPPGRLRYRLLTGPDDAELCRRISAALGDEEVWLPERSPSRTDGRALMVADG